MSYNIKTSSESVEIVTKVLNRGFLTQSSTELSIYLPSERNLLKNSATFFRVILTSLIEVQNMFLIINFDVWDRLGHVWTIIDTVGLLGSIFHCHVCEDFVSKWADLSVCKAFISKSLIKALQTLKSAHFDTKSSQIWQWKIDPSTPTVSIMVQTCPNRSQTSKLIIRNTFWTSINLIKVTLKKVTQPL